MCVALVLVVGLLLVAVGAVDRRQRARELDRILARAAAAQATIGYADRRIAGTLSYVEPQVRRPATSPQVRASLRALVQGEADGQLAALRTRRAAVRDVAVWPWHRANVAAREQYVDYLDTRISYLLSVATDFSSLFRSHPELARSSEAARSALTAAAGPAGTERVDAALR